MAEETPTCRIWGKELMCDAKKLMEMFKVGDLHPDEVEERVSEGCAEACADIKGDTENLECQDRCSTDEMKKLTNNIESCFEKFFENHPVKGVEKVEFDWPNDKVKITLGNKVEFLNSIRETINGVGMFEYPSNKDFVYAAGGTINKVIVSHLAWLKDAPEVWGTMSPKRCIESD